MTIETNPHAFNTFGRLASAFIIGFLAFSLALVILFFVFINIIGNRGFYILSIPILASTITGIFVYIRMLRHFRETWLIISVESMLLAILAIGSIAVAVIVMLLGDWSSPKPEFFNQVTREQSRLHTLKTLNKYYTDHSAGSFGNEVYFTDCYQFANHPTGVLASLNNDYLSNSWRILYFAKISSLLKKISANQPVSINYFKWASPDHTYELNSTIVIYKLSGSISKSNSLKDGTKVECAAEANSHNVKQGSYILEENISHEYHWVF